MKKKFIERLKDARKKAALSQEKLALLLGTSQQNYQRYEKGLAEPNLEQIHRLCVILGVSADWLFDLDGVPAPAPVAAVASECPECVRKDAVIADQARALLEMTSALSVLGGGAKKKTAPRHSLEPSCKGRQTAISPSV